MCKIGNGDLVSGKEKSIMLVTMKEILERANRENYAVCAPDVWSELDARACVEAAEEVKAPIILDASYRMNPDIIMFGRILTELAKKASVPVAVHLDHGTEYEKKTQQLLAIRAGFTSIMVDYSTLPFEENVARTREMVDLAHLVNVTVESEIGHVARGFEGRKEEGMTDPEVAEEFACQTGVDALAIAIGNEHGTYHTAPQIDFDRLREIKKRTGNMPLVLHGSSGLPEDQLRQACREGINKVNICQDIMLAARSAAMSDELESDGVYGLWSYVRQGIKNKVKYNIAEVYGSAGKAWIPDNKGLSDVVLPVRPYTNSYNGR